MESGQHQIVEKTPPQGFFIRERECNILLAHDIDDPVKGREKIPLYDAVGSLCSSMGHEIFLPYRSVGFQGDSDELPGPKAHQLINEIMIPQVRLVLCYMGINSSSVRTMDQRAKKLDKDIIYFYEEGTRLETVAEVEAKNSDLPKADPSLLDIPRAFLHRDANTLLLDAYPYIKGAVEFNSIDDCIYKLRETLNMYYIKR